VILLVFRELRKRKKLPLFLSRAWMENKFPSATSKENLCSLFFGLLGDRLAEKSC